MVAIKRQLVIVVDDPSVTGGVDGDVFGFDEGAGADRGAGGGAGELGVVGARGGGGGEFGLDGLCFGDLDGALGGGFGFALGGAPGLEAVARLGGGGEGDGLALAEFMAALGTAFNAGGDAGEGAFAAGFDRQGELGHGDGGAEDVDVFLGVGNVEVAGGVEGDACEEFEGDAAGFGDRFDEDAGCGEFVDRFRFGDEDVAVRGVDGDGDGGEGAGGGGGELADEFTGGEVLIDCMAVFAVDDEEVAFGANGDPLGPGEGAGGGAGEPVGGDVGGGGGEVFGFVAGGEGIDGAFDGLRDVDAAPGGGGGVIDGDAEFAAFVEAAPLGLEGAKASEDVDAPVDALIEVAVGGVEGGVFKS